MGTSAGAALARGPLNRAGFQGATLVAGVVADTRAEVERAAAGRGCHCCSSFLGRLMAKPCIHLFGWLPI